MRHELKIWPEFFREVVAGKKTFEIRFNDRDFAENDTVILKEWQKEKERFSGSEIRCKIKYVLTGSGFGLEPGFCVFAFDVESVFL